MRQSKGLLATSKDSGGPAYQEPTFSEFGSLPSSTYKWGCGVLAPNGKIYCGPNRSPDILVIDPENRTTYTIPCGMQNLISGVLAPNGKIYFIQSKSSTPRGTFVVDPQNDTTYTLPDNGVTAIGAVITSDNTLVCKSPKGFPGSFYNINTDTDTTSVANGSINTNIDYKQPIILSDDKIIFYQTEPLRAQPFVRVVNFAANPIERGVDWFGAGGDRWPDNDFIGVGVYGADETIYYHCTNVSKFLIYNAASDDLEILDSDVSTANGGWNGGAFAPNGRVYFAPYGSGEVLEIDPFSKTARGLGTFNASIYDHKWATFVLAANGKLYGIPTDKTTILEVDLGVPSPEGSAGSEYWTLPGLPDDKLDPRSRFFNHY